MPKPRWKFEGAYEVHFVATYFVDVSEGSAPLLDSYLFISTRVPVSVSIRTLFLRLFSSGDCSFSVEKH